LLPPHKRPSASHIPHLHFSGRRNPMRVSLSAPTSIATYSTRQNYSPFCQQIGTGGPWVPQGTVSSIYPHYFLSTQLRSWFSVLGILKYKAQNIVLYTTSSCDATMCKSVAGCQRFGGICITTLNITKYYNYRLTKLTRIYVTETIVKHNDIVMHFICCPGAACRRVLIT
jgi:hypothetical protein